MTHQDRVAIARVLSDVVRADNIIDESETNLLATFFDESSKYKLTYDILKESRSQRFSDAVRQLCYLSHEERQALYRNIVDLALVDGICDPHEAALITAIKYVWEIDGLFSDNHTKLLACQSDNIRENTRFVIYVERDRNEDANAEIISNINLISLMLKQWGFHFIYIPRIAERIREMSQDYVVSVLKYIAPDLTDHQIREVYDRACSLTTSEFLCRVLINRLKMDDIDGSIPTLLINIGTSAVPYYSRNANVDYYTEFLAFPVNRSIVSTIEDFTRQYGSFVTVGALPDNRNQMLRGENNFQYFGFYKAILDFLVKAENTVGQIVLCKRTSQIYVPIIHKEVSLSPQECAVYHLIVEMSLTGCGLPSCYTNKKEMAAIYHRYKELYGIRSTKNQDFPSSLPPIVSRINKKLKSELAALENLEQIMPVNEDGYYRIKLTSELVKLAETPHNAMEGIKLVDIIATLQ